MRELYIGLMSGTSADGIDAVIVDFTETKPLLIAEHFIEFQPDTRKRVLALNQPGPDEINRLGELDRLLGKAFGYAVKILLKKSGLMAEDIRAIGSHGQTIRHRPDLGFTLQIGDPNIIAAETGIMTIADFRRKDMAYGGQGAPLVPSFHQSVFGHLKHNKVIVNMGGVANITFLPDDNSSISGFDTGPGNNLMNAWTQRHLEKSYDKNGDWAKQGEVAIELLKTLLLDPYFQAAPPKSTGPEYFNLRWLERHFTNNITPVDVQATLAELTAVTIANAIKKLMHDGEALICGGGVHNQHLMQRLSTLLAPMTVLSTEAYGVHPDWMEAMAFAWLAKQTLEKKPGNIKEVTGARHTAVLGGIYV